MAVTRRVKQRPVGTFNQSQIFELKSNGKKTLPRDIQQTVGKVKLFSVDVFSNIFAFFQIIKSYLLGQIKMNMKEIANQRAYDRKMYLYNDKKLKPFEKAYLSLIGKNLSSIHKLEDVEDLKAIDPEIFKFFKAIASNKDMQTIQSKLKEIKKDASKNNYYITLVYALKFAKSLNVSNEVKNLLKNKLKKITDKKVRKFKKPKNLYMISKTEKERLTRAQKIAIGLLVLGAGSVAGYNYLTSAPAVASAIKQTDVLRKAISIGNEFGNKTFDVIKMIRSNVNEAGSI